MRDKEAEKLWDMQRKLAAQNPAGTGKDIQGFDPNEDAIGGIGDVSTSAYDSRATQVASLIPEDDLAQTTTTKGNAEASAAASTFVIEGVETGEASLPLRTVFSGKKSAMIMFYSNNCSWCHTLMPEFEKASAAYRKYHTERLNETPADPRFLVWIKINTSENPEAVKALKVTSIPQIFKISISKDPNDPQPDVTEYPSSNEGIPEDKKADFRKVNGLLAFAEFA
jgi:thiol-disulfide isomerase/thioredoxin